MTLPVTTYIASCVKRTSVRKKRNLVDEPTEQTEVSHSISAIPRLGWTVDSSKANFNQLYTIDANRDTRWRAVNRKEWIQVDMKKSHYVHRVHIDMDIE